MGSTVNIVNSIIGGGVLALPSAFAATGLVLGVVIVFVVGFMSFGTSYMLSSLVRYCKRRAGRSYKALGERAFGLVGGVVIDVCFILFLFGGTVGYVVIIGDLLTPYFETLTGWPEAEANRWLVEAIVIFVVVYPLCLLKRLDALKYTSFVALVCILYLVLVVMVQSLQRIVDDFDSERVVLGNANFGVFQALPIVTFSFTFHMQLFGVQNEMKRPKTVGAVSAVATLFAGVCYLIVGIFGYLTFFEQTSSNILTDYEETVPITIGKIALALVITFSFPLLNYPLREAVLSLLFPAPSRRSCWDWWQPRCQPAYRRQSSSAYAVIGGGSAAVSDSEGAYLFDAEASPAGAAAGSSKAHLDHNASDTDSDLSVGSYPSDVDYMSPLGSSDDEDGTDDSNLFAGIQSSRVVPMPCGDALVRRIIASTVSVCLTFLASIAIPNISAIFGLVGATVGSCLVFIIPAILFIRLRPEPLSSWKKIAAIIVAILGAFFFVVGTYETLVNWNEN
jgi:amino acid permease